MQELKEKLAGKFIVFDGGEGCGKTTQVALLRRNLENEGCSVTVVRDPGATRVGELIRAILLNPDLVEMSMRCEMLLYMAARAQMVTEIMAPAMKASHVVISDRFVSSTFAYQLNGDGLTANEIYRAAICAISDHWPDQTFILDMPVAQSHARITRAKDRIEQRSLDYHERVRLVYLSLGRADELRHVGYNLQRNLTVLDASAEAESIAADVLEVLKTRF